MKIELEDLVNDCIDEIEKIKAIVDAKPLDVTTQYLNKYTLIKACGTIEFVFKAIIANYFDGSSMIQVHSFINKNVRESSANPRYGKICDMLKTYDDQWLLDFKNSVNMLSHSNKVRQSLDSLVEHRNAFAHGKTTTITVASVKEYFADAVVILKLLDIAVK